MSKRQKQRVVLSDYKAKTHEEGAVEIDLGDGGVVTIDPPPLWPDEVAEMLRADDQVGAATALLGGEEQYATFKAAGGSALMLLDIVRQEHGLPAGE